MRAIIRTTTNIEVEGLDALLMDKDWWPSLPQDHPEVIAKKNEILDHVSTVDRALTEGTYRYTIYDEGTKSWGIVNSPTKHGFTFRLKNPDSDKLKRACKKLVSDLQNPNITKKHDGTVDFKFIAPIEVLEPNSENHAYAGEVLPKKRFRLALRNKRPEYIVGVGALALAAILMIMTIPGIEKAVFSTLSIDMHAWTKGFLERFATSAFVTATVSLVNVALYYLELRRKSIIQWIFD